MRPTSTNIGSNVPAFLSKLWKMVNDPDTDQLISWSPGGHSFIIQNEAQFWYNLLPIYYKHNNMSSFIRQLNMYGFHKISSENGGMDCDKDEIKFFHPFFQQDQPNLIKHIKRKIASSKTSTTTGEENKVNSVDQITRVLVDVKHLRGRQESVDNQLAAMKQENAALWRELALLRQKHMKQQQIVNKLIQFLVTIVQPARSGLGGIGVKRRFPLMLNDSRFSKQSKTDPPSDGPTIHELDAETALTDSLLLSDEASSSTDKTKPDSAPTVNRLIDTPNALLGIADIDDTDPSSDEPDDLIVPPQLASPANMDPSSNNTAVADLLAESRLNEPDSSTEEFPLQEAELQQVIDDKDILQAANEYMDLNTLKCSAASVFDNTVSTKEMLNPNMRDAMITSLVSEPFETDKPKTGTEKSTKEDDSSTPASKNTLSLTVATRSNPSSDLGKFKVHAGDDLDSHLETTQDELDSIKEMLFDGYSLDANALLGLFNPEENFPLDVPPQLSMPEESKETGDGNYGDPLMSGSELMTYSNAPYMLDFENLFEDSSEPAVDSSENNQFTVVDTSVGDQITTPIMLKKEPDFPKSSNSK